MKCGHTQLVFGCEGCIAAVRNAWERATYLKYVREYEKQTAGKTCGRHGTRMTPYTCVTIEGKFYAVLTCQKLTAEGAFICEDQDLLVLLE